MEEIKVGDFIRTANGVIGKIKYITNDMFGFEDSNRDYIDYKSHNFYDSKTGSSLKDLVQAGDLIKISEGIYEVIFDESYQKLGILVPNRTCLSVKHSSLEYIFNQYKDVEILTKEQFNQMKYIVGDESNE